MILFCTRSLKGTCCFARPRSLLLLCEMQSPKTLQIILRLYVCKPFLSIMSWKDTKFCKKPLFSIRGFVLQSVKSCYICAPFWSRLTLMSSKENCIFPTIINNQNWLNFFLKSIEISFGETKIQFSKTIRTTAGKSKQNLLTSSKALWHLSYIIWTGVLADLDPPRFGHPPRIWTPNKTEWKHHPWRSSRNR